MASDLLQAVCPVSLDDACRQPAVVGGSVLRYFPVCSTDTDVCDRMKPDVIFMRLQELAYDGVEAVGAPQQLIDGMNICWMLSRVSLRMTRLPVWRDWVGVETWLRAVDGVFFNRDFMLYDAEGAPIGAAATAWFLASALNHHPVRPGELTDRYPVTLGRPEPALRTGNAIRFKLRPHLAGCAPLLSRTVFYNDLDRNGHVNNTRYVAFAVDAAMAFGLPQDARICGVDLHFVSEVKCGDSMALYVCEPAVFPMPDGRIPDCRALAVEGRHPGGGVVFSAVLQVRTN